MFLSVYDNLSLLLFKSLGKYGSILGVTRTKRIFVSFLLDIRTQLDFQTVVRLR